LLITEIERQKTAIPNAHERQHRRFVGMLRAALGSFSFGSCHFGRRQTHALAVNSSTRVRAEKVAALKLKSCILLRAIFALRQKIPKLRRLSAVWPLIADANNLED
jgi:hypothetical protein